MFKGLTHTSSLWYEYDYFTTNQETPLELASIQDPLTGASPLADCQTRESNAQLDGLNLVLATCPSAASSTGNT